MSKTPEYQAWRGMRERCGNVSDTSYHRYGGRGIKVCDEWQASFEEFFAHIGPRPSSLHSIDRIDNSRGYEPGNVRWATRKTQQQNLRSNVFVEHNGEQHCLREWARRTGISHKVIAGRIRWGWTTAQALGFEPPPPFKRGRKRVAVMIRGDGESI